MLFPLRSTPFPSNHDRAPGSVVAQLLGFLAVGGLAIAFAVAPVGPSLAQETGSDMGADMGAPVDPADAYTPHTWGAEDAPVEMLEFSSYTCGHCSAFHTETLPTLKENYIDTGKVRLVLIDFPLDNVAAAVSMMTHCAPEGTGRKLVDIFYGDQGAWMTRKPVESITGIARLAGMTETDVNACLENEPLYKAILERRAEAAERWNISGTPTFVIDGKRHQGSYALDDITQSIDAALTAAEEPSAAD